jgi:hypothetical protein
VIAVDVYLFKVELLLYTYNYSIPIIPRLTGPWLGDRYPKLTWRSFPGLTWSVPAISGLTHLDQPPDITFLIELRGMHDNVLAGWPQSDEQMIMGR